MIGMSHRRPLLLFLCLLLLFVGSYGWLQYTNIDKAGRLFEALDTAKISTISFVHPGDSCHLVRQQPRWRVNATADVDPFVLGTVLQILQRSQSRRQLQGKEASSIEQRLEKEGCRVHIIQSGKPYSFRIWGNPTQQRSYAQLDGQLHEVYIPGQAGYLVGLFFLRGIQWRFRRLFYSDAHSLKSIRLIYPQQPEDSLYIRIQARQPHIAGLQEMDTSSVYTYLAQYELFYTNEYIQKGQVPAYDSLLLQPPLAYLEVEDLYPEASRRIVVYARSGDPYFLLQEDESLFSLCERSRFLPLLKRKTHFVEKK